MIDRRADALMKLFRAFSGSKDRMGVYEEALRGLSTDDLEAAINRTIAVWERSTVPPVAVVLSKARDVAQDATQFDRPEPQQRTVALTPEELERTKGISELGRRGIFWNPRERVFSALPDLGDLLELFGMPDAAWEPPAWAVEKALTLKSGDSEPKPGLGDYEDVL